MGLVFEALFWNTQYESSEYDVHNSIHLIIYISKELKPTHIT